MQQTNRSSLHLRRFYLCMGSIWFALRTAQGFQLVKVHNGHHAPRQLHHALALEVAQHPGDDLPVGTQVVGDGLMGEPQLSAALNCGLLQEERRDALIEVEGLTPENTVSDSPRPPRREGGFRREGGNRPPRR